MEVSDRVRQEMKSTQYCLGVGFLVGALLIAIRSRFVEINLVLVSEAFLLGTGHFWGCYVLRSRPLILDAAVPMWISLLAVVATVHYLDLFSSAGQVATLAALALWLGFQVWFVIPRLRRCLESYGSTL
jgi:hypothetical protein